MLKPMRSAAARLVLICAAAMPFVAGAATPAPATNAGAAAAAPAPAAAGGKVCPLEISGNDLMQYDKKELKAGADCGKVKLTLKHIGKLPANVMGHTWVLAKTADVAAVSAAGLAAGLAANYVPPGDKRVIASTPIVGGGQSISVTFSTAGLKAGEDYTFFCSFPGHNVLMKGKFTFG